MYITQLSFIGTEVFLKVFTSVPKRKTFQCFKSTQNKGIGIKAFLGKDIF